MTVITLYKTGKPTVPTIFDEMWIVKTVRFIVPFVIRNPFSVDSNPRPLALAIFEILLYAYRIRISDDLAFVQLF